jgi:hypothetical protein
MILRYAAAFAELLLGHPKSEAVSVDVGAAVPMAGSS